MCEGCVESNGRGVWGGGSVERGVRGCGEGYEECVRGVERGLERGLERGVRGGCRGV